MIETIITQINAPLIAATLALDVKILGLAEPIIIQDDEVILPMVKACAEGTYPFVDDDYQFGLYHKLNGKTYTNETNKGFGDNNRVVCTADMSIIVWGFDEHFKAEELETFIFSKLPETCRIYSVNFDKKRVFSEEFSRVPYFINEDTFLFKINYKVAYVVKKSCVTINELLTN